MNKSILIGDIGSTKSSWWFTTDLPHEVLLSGYNPLSHSTSRGDDLFRAVHRQTGDIPFSDIWYYGTGVIDHHISNEIRNRMLRIFPTSHIHVASDLVGASIAACKHDAGTVAILGTGSNAAVFDGHKIIRQASSLGYILGDEGGGCDIGKALLQGYFYHEMPDSLSHEMAPRLVTGRDGFLNDLRASESPNQFLADFARVAVLFQEHPWIKELVRSRFKLFLARHVVPLSPSGPVHIVGSIGCIFAGLIQEELENIGLTAGNFIKDPAHRLFEIHLEHERKEN